EAAGRVRAPGGDHVVGHAVVVLLRLFRGDLDVVDPAAEATVGGGRVVVADEDPVDALARGDLADVGHDVVPLVGVERLGLALLLRVDHHTAAIGARKVRQIGAVGE